MRRLNCSLGLETVSLLVVIAACLLDTTENVFLRSITNFRNLERLVLKINLSTRCFYYVILVKCLYKFHTPMFYATEYIKCSDFIFEMVTCTLFRWHLF